MVSPVRRPPVPPLIARHHQAFAVVHRVLYGGRAGSRLCHVSSARPVYDPGHFREYSQYDVGTAGTMTTSASVRTPGALVRELQHEVGPASSGEQKCGAGRGMASS